MNTGAFMTSIVKPYTWPIVFLLPLAAGLLNAGLFGDPTLAAYFGYTFFAGCVALIFVIRAAIPVAASSGSGSLAHSRDSRDSRGLFSIAIQPPVLVLFALALFIFLHGSITHTVNLTHYYWVANAVWFWTARRMGDTGDNRGITFLYKGVSLLALLESLIVFSQALSILPSKNPFYTCTGSWGNPNVTAMFLSLALYSALEGMRSEGTRKPMPWLIPGLILLATVLLQCRTAILVSALFLIGHYRAGLASFFKSRTPLFKGIMAIAAILVCVTAILLLAFGIKRGSTEGRLRIWKTSIQLIGQRPMTGSGFGRFEKEYNLFTAKERLPDNDHVNMPYNDLLEFGVEGGLGAMALWVLFLIALWRQRRKQGYSILPILAFLVIQLTNFGFQALPALALFLLYAAIPPGPPFPRDSFIREQPRTAGDHIKNSAFAKSGLACIYIITALILVHQVILADNFYKTNIITRDDAGNDAIEAYSDLAPSMSSFVSFHMHFGDAYLKMRQYRHALSQYLQGATTSSRPDLFIKCGYCYQQLGMYDSSRYYYTLVGNMQPYKFGPRMALLRLYEQQGDAPMIKKTAEDILAMPVKVESDEVVDIQSYARHILKKEK
jgi:O-antigen polymerase